LVGLNIPPKNKTFSKRLGIFPLVKYLFTFLDLPPHVSISTPHSYDYNQKKKKQQKEEGVEVGLKERIQSPLDRSYLKLIKHKLE
jgi:hypothetical protein